MKFTDLGLSEPILRAVAAESYLVPTPIQAKAIPLVLAGRDVLGCAQTGTGKTAAFALPIAQRLSGGGSHVHPRGVRPIRCLILSPTRELALQIAESFTVYARHTGLRHTAIFGGVNQNPQVRALNNGVDIVIATPGRLEDLMQQGYVNLRSVEVFVLDEADRMLDMGFIQPIRRIAAAVPTQRQTLLFSATMPREILHLAHALLRDPVSVQVENTSTTPTIIEQSVYLTHAGDKPSLLAHLLRSAAMTRTLVFTRTKHGADKVVKRLSHAGITAEAIHGNKRQNVRQRTLDNFKSGRTQVLIATDIAARGIDVDDVSHVVNYELPHEPETYIHRIGRTGRAGNTGIAIAFCDYDERGSLKAIERLVKKPIRVEPTPTIERIAEPIRIDGERERDDRRFDRSPFQRDRREQRPASPSRGGAGRDDHRRAQAPSHAHSQPARSPSPFGRRDAAPAAAAAAHPQRPAYGRPLSGRPAPRVPGNSSMPRNTAPAPAAAPAQPAGRGPNPIARASAQPRRDANVPSRPNAGPVSTRKPHRKGQNSAR